MNQRVASSLAVQPWSKRSDRSAGDSEDDHRRHNQEHLDADHTPDALLTTDSVGEARFAPGSGT
jgi:hypothetical protein